MRMNKNGTAIDIAVEGKLDRSTAPGFEKDVGNLLSDDVRLITIDLKDCIYISSAGLRSVLSLEKNMNKCGGKLVIKNIPELVREVFVETGLDEILTLE